jgi:plastocyanin domain-containing protein
MKKTVFAAAIVFLASFSAYADGAKKEFSVTVTDKGFEPKLIHAKSGEHVVLNITRKTDATCAKEVQVPSVNKNKIDLPLNKVVSVDLGELKKGDIKFGCGMMMETAQIHVN